MTPGAADKNVTKSRAALGKRRASDPADNMASEVRDSNGRDHDLQDDEVSPRSRSVEDKDCDKPKLNPEQALNLTDGDVDDLRKLLVDNVST